MTDTDEAAIDPAVWKAVWAVLVGGLAVLFDTTIVSVALRTLAHDLDVPVSTIQWVTTAYLLALAVTLPLAGWAQRRVGAKRLWLIALSIFLVGSILSSLAWSAESLIAFRVVQGAGGGVLMPLMATVVMQAAGGRNVGRIMSVVGMPAVLGPILGPVVGGLILQHFDWSWLFWVNVPFCVVGAILAWRWLPEDRPTAPPRKLDVVGFILLVPGLIGVLLALSNAERPEHFSRTDVLVPLIAGVALIAAFAAWALQRGSSALLDLRLLRYPQLSAATVAQFFSGITLFGALLLVPFYFQAVRGQSALSTGLLLIVQGIGTLAIRSYIGRLSDRVGARWLVVTGFTLVAAGTVPFALADSDTSYAVLLSGLFVRGVGMGVATVPLMTVGFRGIERHEVPDASVVTRIAQQVGGSFGTAVLALVLSTSTASAGLVGGFQHAFAWALGFTVVGIVLAFLLPSTLPAAGRSGPGGPPGTGNEERATVPAAAANSDPD